MLNNQSSPSCGDSQCRPPPPAQQQQQQPPPQQQHSASFYSSQPPPRPPPPAVAVAVAATGVPSNPLHTVQGQVLEQDVLKPSAEVYGAGCAYITAKPARACAVSGSYSPTDRDDACDAYKLAPVASGPPSHLAQAPQVVTYGQARSDNAATFMSGDFQPAYGTPAAPVVGIVQQPRQQQQKRSQQQQRQQRQQQRSSQQNPRHRGQGMFYNATAYGYPSGYVPIQGNNYDAGSAIDFSVQ